MYDRRRARHLVMTRRRRWDDAGEPLFGEEWWAADQRLFADSLARRGTRPTRNRRARRSTTLQKQDRTAGPGPIQGMLPWFEDPPGADDELLRADGPASLGQMGSAPVRDDRESGRLLLG